MHARNLRAWAMSKQRMAPSVRTLALSAALATPLMLAPAAMSYRVSDPIRPVIRRHINEVKGCYERGLLRRPDLAGRVVLHLEIAVDGAVAQASTESTAVRDAPVLWCIADRAARWRFPRSPDGREISVTYPFLLQPADSPRLMSTAPWRAEIRYCYEQALLRRAADGALTLSIDVRPSGEVGAVTVEPSAPMPDVAACLRTAARRWRFPAAGTAMVTRTLFLYDGTGGSGDL